MWVTGMETIAETKIVPTRRRYLQTGNSNVENKSRRWQKCTDVATARTAKVTNSSTV
jgi:hypothetical protein